MTLRQQSLAALAITDPTEKLAAVAAIENLLRQPDQFMPALLTELDVHLQSAQKIPGHPERPLLVSPKAVEKRGIASQAGRAALVHALAHIEFNAINLALDIVWRFPGMPARFYMDWLSVAVEEARHFQLLANHLLTLGYAYGDFNAHNGLWDMAEKTQHNLKARLALVPKTLEARGLDVTPAIRAKLAQAGDQAGAEILDIILRDEIGHVAIGNHWFAWLCLQDGSTVVESYLKLSERYQAPALKGPFNLPARLQAGFNPEEMQQIYGEGEAPESRLSAASSSSAIS